MGWINHYWLLTAILSSVFFALSSFIVTLGAKRHYSISQMLLGLYLSGAILFGLFIIINNGLNINNINKTTVIWGIIIGLGSALGNAFFTYALRLGPVSLTAPLANTNVILVILMSVFYYQESLRTTQFLGVMLLVIGCFLLPFDPKEKKHIKKNTWFIVMLFTIFFMFLLNGGLKITHELFLNNSFVLFYSYVFALFLFTNAIIFSRWYFQETFGVSRKSISTGAIAGVFSFLGLQMYTLALSTGPASVIVPIFSSRNAIVAILCIWYFKEKLSQFQKIALGLLLSGLLSVSI